MIYGKDNRELMEGVRRHPDFNDFVVPISALDEVRDATFFLRNDGLLAFSEGYCHPKGKLVANIIYIPDPAGTKNFFGARYGSVIKQYLKEGEAWVPFKRQLEIYRKIDPSTQEGKPIFAENKCLFDLGDFVGFVPPRRSLAIARKRSAEIDRSIRNVGALMGIDPERSDAVAFAASAGIGAAAGILVAPIFFVTFNMGASVGLKGFVAAVLGGLGTIPGAIVGGFFLGVVESLAGGLISSGYRDAITFALLIVVLWLKPSGLFLRKNRQKV